MIVAVVLAAGLSRRMEGGNKLLARNPAGESVIGRTVAAIRASRVDRVVGVVGHAAAAVRAAAGLGDGEWVFCAAYASGMAASLRAGLAALPDEAAAALICLGDMPLIRPGLIDRLLAARRGGDIVLPVAGGRRGHPVLFDGCFLAEMAGITGDQGAKSVLARHAGRVRAVAVDDDSIGLDVDSPADLALLPDGPWLMPARTLD